MSYGHYWPFSVWSMVSPYTKLLKNASNDILIHEFHNVTRHYVKDTEKKEGGLEFCHFAIFWYPLCHSEFLRRKMEGGLEFWRERVLNSFICQWCLRFFTLVAQPSCKQVLKDERSCDYFTSYQQLLWPWRSKSLL